MPIKSNKQQETYADMTTHYTDCRCSMDIVIPIGIYCYFGFDLIEKLRSFRFVKRKASINAILICPKPTPKRTIAKRFSQDTYSLQRRIRLQNYNKFLNCASSSAKKSPFMFEHTNGD